MQELENQVKTNIYVFPTVVMWQHPLHKYLNCFTCISTQFTVELLQLIPLRSEISHYPLKPGDLAWPIECGVSDTLSIMSIVVKRSGIPPCSFSWKSVHPLCEYAWDSSSGEHVKQRWISLPQLRPSRLAIPQQICPCDLRCTSQPI